MTIKYETISFLEHADRIQELGKQHLTETDTRYFDKDTVEIDLDQYAALEEAGFLMTVAALDEGKVVGGMTVLITPSLHIKGNTQAVADALFVDKEYRSKGIAKGIIEEAESLAKEIGVNTFIICFRANDPRTAFAEQAGYSFTDVQYSKNIGGV